MATQVAINARAAIREQIGGVERLAREMALRLPALRPDRYLVINANWPFDEIGQRIKDRIREILPDPVPHGTEANTGSFAAIPDHLPDAESWSVGDSFR